MPDETATSPVVPTQSAPTQSTALVPAPTHPNVFQPIALLMGSIPAALEAPNVAGAAPRYIRIARLRQFLKPVKDKDEPVAGAMATGVGYFTQGMAFVLKYSLKLQDLLVQGDAGKALFETAAQLVKTVAREDFQQSLVDLNDAVIGAGNITLDGLKSTLGPVNTAVDTAEKYVGLIPEPRDLEVIGQQLYRMLVVEWVPEPTDRAKESAPVDMQKTGRLRLLLWALNKPFRPLDVGAGADLQVMVLGQRRLWKSDVAALPTVSTGSWQAVGAEKETVFDADFKGDAATADIKELQTLLRGLGYQLTDAADGAFDAATEKGLAQFQHVNKLDASGVLDLPTLNQLMHLRYDPDPTKGRVQMAKRYDDKALSGFVWPKP